MAITSAICNSFKAEVLQALHNFTASSGNTFKLALYTSSATLNKFIMIQTVIEQFVQLHSVQIKL